MITGLLNPPAYGHAIFNDMRTAAVSGANNFDGTPSGIPPNFAMTVNDQGLFFIPKLKLDQDYYVGPRAYRGKTLTAQLTILVHELAHQMHDAGGAIHFMNDAGNEQAGRANDTLVDINCRSLIESVR
jgi:hypothetical protein